MTIADGAGRDLRERLGLALDDGRQADLRRFLSQGAVPLENFLNGESYFFRYPVYLRVLEQRLASGATGPFRVLCPACSTGEEVYSAAFALTAPARAANRLLELVGADVRAGAVEAARAGLYGPWSLRNTSREQRELLFTGDDPFRVRDEYRAAVRFRVANLLDPIADGPYDAVVLCNATLYMHEAAWRRAYANVRAALKPDGLLLVAPTDPLPPADAWRRIPTLDGWAAYGPASSADAAVDAPPLPALALFPEDAGWGCPPPPPAPRLPRKGRRALSTAPRSDTAPRPVPSRYLLCDADAELLALVGSGRLDGVEHELRRRIFFEPASPLLRAQLGLVLWEQGWLQRAERELRQARRLLAAAPADALVSCWTAGRLRDLIDDWSAAHG